MNPRTSSRLPAALLLTLALSALLQSAAVHAQHAHHEPGGEAPKWANRYTGLHFPVGTRNAQAQRLVDQGLLLVYAFNHDAAARAFAHAAQLDPELGMAHWGVALAMGAYINGPFTDERYRRGREAALRGVALKPRMTVRERAYVDAMMQRYDVAKQPDYLDQQRRYATAMKLLADRYRDDLDAATLAAEARMTLNPWRLWNEDGRPADGTAEIVATLESVLARDPDHLGANHFLVHALEASPTPERALTAAMRLDALDLDTGHLAHMPGHIYMRTGDYAALVRSNRKAAKVDEAFLDAEGADQRVYTGYYLHNLDFIIVGETERGNLEGALEAVRRYDAVARGMIARRPGAEYLLARQATVLLRFHRWAEVLALEVPAATQHVSHAYFQYARGVASPRSDGSTRQGRRAAH